MKFDPDRINGISARRTLKNLQKSMIEMMQTQPIEKISVMDLCEHAMVPRATFYNYFEDKYDLLHFCWQQLEAEMKPVFQELNEACDDGCGDGINKLTEKIISHVMGDMKKWQKIRRANIHDILVPDLFNYMASQALTIMRKNPEYFERCTMPLDLLAYYYASSILALANWLLSYQNIDPQIVQEYYHKLIKWENFMD